MRKQAISFMILMSVSMGVYAEQGQRDIALMASSCAACHGTDGNSVGGMPRLAGLAADYIVEQMRQFKTGQRLSTVMGHLASGYTDDEIRQLATYFSEQK